MEGCREDGYAAGWRMFEGRELVSRYECLMQKEGKGDRNMFHRASISIDYDGMKNE